MTSNQEAELLISTKPGLFSTSDRRRRLEPHVSARGQGKGAYLEVKIAGYYISINQNTNMLISDE